MKEKILYCIWAALYIICAGLGTADERGLGLRIILSIFSLVFFIPGFLLIYLGRDNKKALLRIRVISICSLLLTVVLIVVNIVNVTSGDAVGQALDDIMNLVSVPMYCSYWRWVSLFLWACLLTSSFPRLWKK